MDFNFDTSSILDVLVLDPGTGSLTIGGNRSVVLPNGSTGERPGAAGAGAIRFNTTSSTVEFYDGSSWQTVQTTAGGSGALSNFAQMTTTGVLVQTSAGQYTARSLQEVSGETVVLNGDGINGNPSVGLASHGTAGTYVTVTTDAKGRVTSGTATQAWNTITGTPTSLSGYGILDAYTKTETDALTWDWSDIVSGTPTTLAGYGITDAASSTDLSNHAADTALHLTSAQNTFLDALTVTSTEVNYLSGVTSNVQTQLGGKLSLTGGTMSGNIVMPAGTMVAVADAPVNATDVANKNYVDNLVTGLTWKPPVDSTGTSTPATATTGERFLNTTDGKIYTATATNTWDAGVAPADGWTLFTRDTETGYVYSGSVWVQFTGAGQIAAGLGLVKNGNQLDINLGAGIAELPTDEVGIDLHASGGLVLTQDGTTPSTNSAAQLAVLAADGTIVVGGSGIKVGTGSITATHLAASVAGTGLTGGAGNALSLATVGTASTYNNVTTDAYGRVVSGTTVDYLTGNEVITVSGDATGSGTTAITLTLANSGVTAGDYVGVTVDAKGRVTGGVTTQAWSTITGTPTTLAGYAITDAVKNAGGISSFQSGTKVAMPSAGTAGAMYVTTDTNAIYRDTGSTWVQVGEAGLLYTENPASVVADSTVTGVNAVSIGAGNTASGANVLATGESAKSGNAGAEVRANGAFSTAGDAQTGKYVLRAATASSASAELFLDGTAAQLVLPTNTTWVYSAYISARRTDQAGNAGFKIEGVVSRDASASSTALVGNRSKTILTRPANSSWDVNVSVDTVTGSLVFTVVGENSANIRWVATVITTEVSA